MVHSLKLMDVFLLENKQMFIMLKVKENKEKNNML